MPEKPALTTLDDFLKNSSPEADLKNVKLSLPFEGDFPVSQGFGGMPSNPFLRHEYKRLGLDGHDGIDFEMPVGTKVLASYGGVILSAGPGIYGTTVVIGHGWGLSYYGHLSAPVVAAGDIVQTGQLIGYSGSSGLTTGPHLHFSIKPNNPNAGNGYFGMVDPSFYLDLEPQTDVLGVSDDMPFRGLRNFRHGEVPLIEYSIGENGLSYKFIGPDGRQIKIPSKKIRKNNRKYLSLEMADSYKPGKYKILISNSQGELQEQDFSWGVLAINTNKGVYLPGETAKLAMAVLNDKGGMVCDAKLALRITQTAQNVDEILTTENGKIKVNDACRVHDYTVDPDYEANFGVKGPGIYQLVLTAQTANGERTVTDEFQVKDTVRFDVERVTGTRIYPIKPYPVHINIKANEDFEGTVEDIVPDKFKIIGSSKWDVSMKKGETKTLSYSFDAPDTSPDFYTLGKLKMTTKTGDTIFEESRLWQLAIDATFQMQTGYYVGDLVDGHAVTGVGFQPELVIVKDDSSNGSDGPHFVTTSFAAGTDGVIGDADANTASGGIKSLDSDGFTLGTDTDVNEANIRYTYIAFRGSDCSSSGTFCVNQYTGDGASSHAITSIGFQPDVLVIKRAGASQAVFKTSSMGTNATQFFSNSNEDTTGTHVKTLDATGFTVGNSAVVNASGDAYNYFAFKAVANKMSVGTFTGNATDDTAVTVGYKPNFVWIKNSNATTPIQAYYNTPESDNDNSSAMFDAANGTGVIKTLTSNGFTVGTNTASNETGKTIYWVAFAGNTEPTASGTYKMKVGTFTGNGTSQSITGVGFRPDLVIIKDQTTLNFAVYRTTTMKGDLTVYLATGLTGFTGGITTLDSDGFSLGSSTVVNNSGDTYHYQAFGNAFNGETKTGAADFMVGAYTGNGVDNHNIIRQPFQPDLIVVRRTTGQTAIMRTSAMSGDISVPFNGAAEAADDIQAINSDGFQVGTQARVNAQGQIVDFFSFKTGSNMKVGTYTGTGSPFNVTSPGIQPELVWVKSTGAQTAAFNTSTFAGDNTLMMSSAANLNDRITALLSNGFSIGGNHSETNTSAVDYRYVVWNIPVTNVAPNSPTSSAQKTTGDVVISTGNWINSTSVKFTASASDPDSTDTLSLCVEKDTLGTSFSNVEDSCGTGVSYTGSPVAVSVTITGQTDASEYHWQARVKDAAGAYSSWVSYGGNAESARDYGLDTTAPSGGTVYDGTSTGIDATFNDGSLSSLSANWSGFNANVSGLSSYDYSIGTTAGGTDVLTWTGNGTATSVTATGLTLNTSQTYYINVRANDNAGNSTTVSSNGQLIQPSLSFSIDNTSLAFSNLNAANSFTDSKNTVLTTSTNAYNGYVIRAYKTDSLRSTIYPADTIGDFSGGSYSSPSGWSGYGLGYTSSDTSVQGSSKFPSSGSCLGTGTAPCYAPFSSSAPGDIVADHTSTVSGSSISNEQYTLTYKVAASPTQPAGPYTTSIVYTITPQY